MIPELLTLLRFDLKYLKCISNRSGAFHLIDWFFQIITTRTQIRPSGYFFRYV